MHSVAKMPESEPESFRNAELSFVALLLRGADLKLAVPVDEEEKGNFFLAAGKYFRASWDELEGLLSLGLPLDEIPVALLLARYSGAASEEVAHRRLAGVTWRDVMDHYCVSPSTIHVPVADPANLPVARPCRYYWTAVKRPWKPLKLTDQDVVNLTNVRFISEYYHYSAEKVIALISSGWSFISIHCEYARPETDVWRRGKRNSARG